MSSTKIHKPADLLPRAKITGTVADQATIFSFNIPVFVVAGPFLQDDIDRYTWCFKSPHIGSWIHSEAVSAGFADTVNPADEKLDFPQIRVGPSLSQDLPPAKEPRFIIIIQGRTGAHKVKVMVANSGEQAATIMMHEALNGYSTVFSASYDGPALQDLPVSAKFTAGDRFGEEVVGGEIEIMKLVCMTPSAPFGF